MYNLVGSDREWKKYPFSEETVKLLVGIKYIHKNDSETKIKIDSRKKMLNNCSYKAK